ncbi:hypothetical protein FQP88_05935 [Vibrio atlanticus]|nr:hypothetical protein FQP88_05935 [Vibrio atlanticus]
MDSKELIEIVERAEVYKELSDKLKDILSEEENKSFLKKLDGIKKLSELKSIIKGCLEKNPTSVEKFKECIENKIKIANKLEDANSVKANEEQEKRTINVPSRSKNKFKI